MDKNKKVAIIGAGAVGLETARQLVDKDFDEILLYNREGTKNGDLLEFRANIIERGQHILDKHCNTRVVPTHDLAAALRGADYVVLALGVRRSSPQQTRFDFLDMNLDILAPFFDTFNPLDLADNPKLLVVTNPVDHVTTIMEKKYGDALTVVGVAGELDSLRYTHYLCNALGLSDPSHLRWNKGELGNTIPVIGEHGPNMIPLVEAAQVYHDGQWEPLVDYAEARGVSLDEIRKKTVAVGREIALTEHEAVGFNASRAIRKMIDAFEVASEGNVSPVIIATSSASEVDSGAIGRMLQIEQGTAKVIPYPDYDLAESERMQWKGAHHAVSQGLGAIESLGIVPVQDELNLRQTAHGIGYNLSTLEV